MTDQTQTTTEPVDSSHGSVYDQLLTLIHDRDHALRGDERTDPNEIDETVLEIMRITTPQPLEIGLDREAVARVIEPSAFKPETGYHNAVFRCDTLPVARATARSKADAILALAAPAEVVEPKWLVHARTVLAAYECDLGEPLDDMHELGRIPESRAAPSFRIRVGHIRPAAPTGETGA